MSSASSASTNGIGAVVENLSNRKLFCILICLAIMQTVFFLLGGLIAPQPSSYMDFFMSHCVDDSKAHYSKRISRNEQWFYLRPHGGCDHPIDYETFADDEGFSLPPGIYGDDFVFVAQMPHVRNNQTLRYSPWFQNLLGVLAVHTKYSTSKWRMSDQPELVLDVRMGYQTAEDRPDVWHELGSARIKRKLRCEAPETRKNGDLYRCDPIELFELGSVDYPFYLVNIRIPSTNGKNGSDHADYNNDIGHLVGFNLIEIHQNGGFTQVWLAMKTILFPAILVAVVWYWRRVRLLPRSPLLLEKALMSLGVAMLFINVPVEWLSLVMRTPFMLLLSDVRQGIFYAMLLSFWLIFVGEHLVGQGGKNQFSFYWKHLGAVFFGCTCMFVFDMCERGVHLTNPFYSIWSTTLGTNLAYGFVILTGVAAVIYFCFLLYWIVRVMFTIKSKRASLANSRAFRRLRFEAIVYRFKFLMFFTVICAALTVCAFIVTKVGEDQLRWGDWEQSPMIHYSSAFLTGVYGMWNIYTMLLLFMYAPSHKYYAEASQLTTCDDDDDENDGNRGVTESSALTTFVKPATD